MQHPNADRLRACRVDIGDGRELSVVCGAPNARTGLHVVFAPPGAVIPGSGMTLRVGEIRGVKSAGMLVSFRELALGDEHDGIIELPDDAPVGHAYAAYAGLDDPVIEIGVTPNRGDALSVRGIARDLQAAGLGALKPWEPAAIAGAFISPLVWRNEALADCPWILGRLIRGVKNGPLTTMAAAPSDVDRATADQRSGGHHQLLHPSTSAGRCMCSMPTGSRAKP